MDTSKTNFRFSVNICTKNKPKKEKDKQKDDLKNTKFQKVNWEITNKLKD